MIVGVTGIPGSGKTTLSLVFADMGAQVIHADDDVRFVLTELEDEIKKVFGKDLMRDGRIDRKALGKKVFSSRDGPEKFNRIIFPYIRSHARARIQDICSGIWVVDAALIHEYRIEGLFDHVIAVVAPLELCLKRFIEKTGYAEEIAKRFFQAQLSQEEKAARSDFVIENRGTVAELKEKAEILYRKLTEGFT